MIKQIKQGLMALVLVLSGSSAWAVIDTYEFNTEQQQEQYKVLIEELRCPKCQNQNLADSNAPIAADMRREIHRMVTEGESNQGVVDFMVARYGDFVNYRPRRDSSTFVLWYGPIGLLALGGVVVLVLARRKRSQQSRAETTTEQPQTEAPVDQERLQRLLKDKE